MKDSNVLYEKSKKYRTLMDRIHDSIGKEDVFERKNDCISASEVGLQSWSYLKELVSMLDAESFCDLEGETIYDLLYWATSLATNLHNASLKDASFFQKRFSFCKEYVEMHENFLDKNMRNIGNIRRDYADCYFSIEDLKTYDGLYEKWLKREPDWGWGWIGWSDNYWLFHRNKNLNLIKAKQILEKGLAVEGVMDKDHMIKRLEDLEKKLKL